MSSPGLLFSRAINGEPPPLTIVGDAALASDVQWLVDNVRWDVEADLERLFGPMMARQLGRLGSSLAAGLRGLQARRDQRQASHASARP